MGIWNGYLNLKNLATLSANNMNVVRVVHVRKTSKVVIRFSKNDGQDLCGKNIFEL